jgi:hypothetical protein
LTDNQEAIVWLSQPGQPLASAVRMAFWSFSGAVDGLDLNSEIAIPAASSLNTVKGRLRPIR